MSGTSLDGLDMAFCRFSFNDPEWNYEILKAETLPYPPELYFSLNSSISMPSIELVNLDHEYGKWIGKASQKFLIDNDLDADWIASHGHTVFHQPDRGFTLQIGNGNDIAAWSGIPVIYDFRSLDVAMGGQGAPLVPAGDEYLFGRYDYCLNLGGFSNISFKKENKRIAFDICPVNMGLNLIAGKMGFSFDENGHAGRGGKVIHGLVEQLNSLAYYRLKQPKSLGREWFIKEVEPLLNNEHDLKDTLRSFYEHIAQQISSVLNDNGGENVLVTGGGAKNAFLMELIAQKSQCTVLLPENNLIDFKEALIFAFLGYLRIHGVPNVFASVTGSQADHCAGVIVVGKV